MYGFNIKKNIPFDTVISKVTEALTENGFGLVTDIDLKIILKAKLNIETRPYRILVTFNPPLAYRTIQANADVGLLLSCNVVVRKVANGTITVSFMDPEAVMNLVDNPEIHQLAQEIKALLLKVSDSLTL